MSLKEIFCQDRAISILQRAYLCGKSAHAYIFAGPEGVGKFKTAGQWSKMLLCKNQRWINHELTRIDTNKKTNNEFVKIREISWQKPKFRGGKTNFADSCGCCQSCRLFEAGSHPDFNLVHKELLEFTKDGKGKTTPVKLPIDVIREFLIGKVSAKPTLSQRKVFVVSEAEKLNFSSQNALLKVLEEPPGYCTIILLSTRLDNLLPTIKSRCQIIRFGPIDEQRIIEQLKQMGTEQAIARYFARLAGGSLGTACQWAKLQLAGSAVYETKRQLVSSLSTCRYADALKLAQWVLDESKNIADAWSKLDGATSKTDISRRAQKTLVRIIISALCDVMRLSITAADRFINFDQAEQIKKIAARFDPERAAGKIADAYKALHWIDSNVNQKLTFEQLLLNLAISDTMKVQRK